MILLYKHILYNTQPPHAYWVLIVCQILSASQQPFKIITVIIPILQRGKAREFKYLLNFIQ